ncbi:MAG: hypothetical protein QG607_35 [Patescibacteria group bacterium]|nr:hypothetical protein [Patescibacteria group bacterium]
MAVTPVWVYTCSVVAASVPRVLGLFERQQLDPPERRRKLGRRRLARLPDHGDQQTDEIPHEDQRTHPHPEQKRCRTCDEIHSEVEDLTEQQGETFTTKRRKIFAGPHDEAVQPRTNERDLLQQEEKNNHDDHPEQKVRPFALQKLDQQLCPILSVHDILQVSSAKSFSGTEQYSRFKLKCQDLRSNPYTKKP